MTLASIIANIDEEIKRFEAAKMLLIGQTKTTTPAAPKLVTKEKRKPGISAEGRKRISEAVKRRWAAQKKAAA